MRKRTSPIILGAALLVLGGAAAIFNLAKSGAFDRMAGDAPPPMPEAPPTNEKVDREQMRNTIRNAGNGKQPTRGSIASEKPGNPEKPVVAVPKPEKYKPVPNPSSTTSQWYTD